MKEIYDNIDKLYKDNFTEYKISPKKNHWNEIYKKTIKKGFFSTDFTRFNILYSVMILSTFVLSVFAFVNAHYKKPIPETQYEIISVKDTENIKTIYIHDTIIEYVKINTVPNIVHVDTLAIIQNYIAMQQSQIDQIQKEPLKQDSANAEIKVEDSTSNLQIIYHTIEKKDTFVKYIEKDEKQSSSNSIFKRNRK